MVYSVPQEAASSLTQSSRVELDLFPRSLYTICTQLQAVELFPNYFIHLSMYLIFLMEDTLETEAPSNCSPFSN